MVRAEFSFFHGTLPASFQSRYGLAESVERLRGATKRSAWAARYGEAAIGRVSAESVSLHRWSLTWHNSFRPYFIGHFTPSVSGAVLVGRFTTHWINRVLFALWFGFCLLWTLLITFHAIIDRAGPWFGPLIGLGMLLFGAALARSGMRVAREDVDWLSNVIRNALAETRVN